MKLTSQVIGNLGADPEVRSSRSGNEYVTMSVAANLYRGKDRGKETVWVDVIVFAQRLVNYLKSARKGDVVIVDGEPSARSFTRRDGTETVVLQITVGAYDGNVILVGRGERPQQPEDTRPISEAIDDEVPF